MPKPSSRTPSKASNITFKNKDDVYHVNDDEATSVSAKSSVKGSSNPGSKTGSKASVKSASAKSSKSSVKEKQSYDKPIASSTPVTSEVQLTHGSLKELNVSPIEPVESHAMKVDRGYYVPSPYVFRTTTPELTKEVKKIPAKCPPYHLQVDHVLAVVWTLFSKEEASKPLGIVQLQWALGFLRGILNRRGEHPKDVGICIQAIEDELIEQYADMVDEVQYVKKPEQTPSKADAKKSKEKSAKKSASKQDEEELLEEEIGETPRIPGEDGAPAGDGEEDDCCLNKCQDDLLVMRQVPFSINYAEMMKRSPPDIEQLFACNTCNTRSKTSSVASGTKKSISGLDQTVSRDNMLEFLKAWRREQVDKIQAELKRLKSIENFIGSAETENFSPYLDEKMEKQLDSLVAQKVVNPEKSQSKSKKK